MQYSVRIKVKYKNSRLELYSRPVKKLYKNISDKCIKIAKKILKMKNNIQIFKYGNPNFAIFQKRWKNI